MSMIRIRPARAQRTAFARWATAQTPKVRTTTPEDFAVPAELFVTAPEAILIGALVDGHRYVSPDEDTATGTPAPGAPEQGQDDPGAAAAAPQTPAGATSAEETATALHIAAGKAAAAAAATTPPDIDGSLPAVEVAGDQVEQPEGVFPCPGCSKEFTTGRGRDTHRRMMHAAGDES